MSLITTGDLIDLSIAFKQKGFSYILSRLNPSSKKRVELAWSCIDNESSDWWIVPAVKRRWNFLITGSTETEYQQYVVEKYLRDRKNLNLISAGCGGGTPELKFSEYGCFKKIEGFDVSKKIVEHANEKASNAGAVHLNFFVADANTFDFGKEKYDVILFHSSLHHFSQLSSILERVKEGLKREGLLIINEYVGPNRMQFDLEQLEAINHLLIHLIPEQFRIRKHTNGIKSKVFPSGKIRMLLSDPSEALKSETILPALHKYFETVEEKKLGGNILHLLLKDIAHHFVELNNEKMEILKKLFDAEDTFIKRAGKSDFVFGIYRRQI